MLGIFPRWRLRAIGRQLDQSLRAGAGPGSARPIAARCAEQTRRCNALSAKPRREAPVAFLCKAAYRSRLRNAASAASSFLRTSARPVGNMYSPQSFPIIAEHVQDNPHCAGHARQRMRDHLPCIHAVTSIWRRSTPAATPGPTCPSAKARWWAAAANRHASADHPPVPSSPSGRARPRRARSGARSPGDEAGIPCADPRWTARSDPTASSNGSRNQPIATSAHRPRRRRPDAELAEKIIRPGLDPEVRLTRKTL